MADEVDKTKDQGKSAESNEKSPARKSGDMVRYILFGVVGVVAVMAIALGTLMLVGGGSTSETVREDAAGQAVNTTGGASPAGEVHGDYVGDEDSVLAALEEDETFIDNIMKSLEVLDYVPDEAELTVENEGMSVEDSIEMANWVEREKAALAEKEKELEAREKGLNALDNKVTQKLLRLEQAESARVTQLAKLYDGMEARAVAKLMANLDDETVVAILPRMKQKNASQVLSLMPAARGARLSKQMITIAEN